MKHMKNCIFCQKKLIVSTINGFGGHLFLVNCDESDPVHEFAISTRGDSKLNSTSSMIETVIAGIKDFKIKYPSEIPQVFFDTEWKLSIVKLTK